MSEQDINPPNLGKTFTALEVAALTKASVRSVERWVQKKGLRAKKATLEEQAQLLLAGRIKSVPPKGIWLIEGTELERIPQLRGKVGCPPGTKQRRVV